MRHLRYVENPKPFNLSVGRVDLQMAPTVHRDQRGGSDRGTVGSISGEGKDSSRAFVCVDLFAPRMQGLGRVLNSTV